MKNCRHLLPFDRSPAHVLRPVLGLGLTLGLALSALIACDSAEPTPPADAGSASSAPSEEAPATNADAGAPASDAGADEKPTGGPSDAIERIEIRVGALTFDARAAGPKQGQLVLLLHGFPQSSFQYRDQLRTLAAAGYRAVAPDQRGYSPRARPSALSDYTILKLVQDAVQIADALEHERFHLVGHDWGGGVAWTVARLYPQRVRSLTMLSTPHPDAMNAELSRPDSCQSKASAYFDAFTGPDAKNFLRGMGSGAQLSFECIEGEALSEYLRIISDDAALDAALNWYRANVKDRKFDAPMIGPIAVPTLYLYGETDTAFCRDAAEASRNYVSSSFTFEVVPQVGHWITECATEIVSDRLRKHVEANSTAP
ncbi:MAG TPA: alpha/beta fold hydrolase [Polyangiales bacterium]